MPARRKLTTTEKSFIKDNRLKMSMLDMEREISVSYTCIRKYMMEMNLMVEKKIVQQIRTNKLTNKKADTAWYWN